MYAALVIHEVSDYATFKAAFDEHRPMREAAGLVMHNVHRDADNPNNVVVFVAAPELDTIQNFLANPGLKEAMSNAGVVGAPDITVLQNRGMDLTPDGTCGVLVRHDVADYDAFRRVFDDHAPFRTAAGMVGWSCNSNAGDDTKITVYVQANDLDKVRAFTADPALKSAMGDAGVTSAPTFLFLNHVEMARYA